MPVLTPFTPRSGSKAGRHGGERLHQWVYDLASWRERHGLAGGKTNRDGEGPPIILVCGGTTDRSANAPLAALLAPHFTVFNYDRRGRGDSGDTAPYAVEREVEDIPA